MKRTLTRCLLVFACILLAALFFGCAHNINTVLSDAADTAPASETVADSTVDSVTEETQESTDALMTAIEEATEADSFADHVMAIENRALDSICKKYNAVGVQCAVIDNGFVTGSYVYGFADTANKRAVTAQTKYRTASLSKLLTAMIFMRLAEKELVALDADISSYYGFRVRSPYHSDIVITPRMLMTHTAAVTDGSRFTISIENGSSIPIESLLTDRNNFLSSKPGTSYVYSNFSYALIGSICELAANCCFEELAQTLFLEPMRLDGGYVASSIENIEALGLLYGGSSTLHSQLAAAFHPVLGQTVHLVQGNLTISATDYAQLLCLLLNGGVFSDGTRLLEEESCVEIFSVQYGEPANGVGLGCYTIENVLPEKNMYTHTGSAYGMYACYAVDPISGDGVVVLTSGADYAMDDSTQLYSICLELIRALFPG